MEVISCKFSFRWYMGVGGGEACSGTQIHPRIPYLEPTYCVVQLEALESPSSSPPMLTQPLLLPEQPVLVPVFSKWNGSTSHKILLFFSAEISSLSLVSWTLPPNYRYSSSQC